MKRIKIRLKSIETPFQQTTYDLKKTSLKESPHYCNNHIYSVDRRIKIPPAQPTNTMTRNIQYSSMIALKYIEINFNWSICFHRTNNLLNSIQFK